MTNARSWINTYIEHIPKLPYHVVLHPKLIKHFLLVTPAPDFLGGGGPSMLDSQSSSREALVFVGEGEQRRTAKRLVDIVIHCPCRVRHATKSVKCQHVHVRTRAGREKGKE